MMSGIKTILKVAVLCLLMTMAFTEASYAEVTTVPGGTSDLGGSDVTCDTATIM